MAPVARGYTCVSVQLRNPIVRKGRKACFDTFVHPITSVSRCTFSCKTLSQFLLFRFVHYEYYSLLGPGYHPYEAMIGF